MGRVLHPTPSSGIYLPSRWVIGPSSSIIQLVNIAKLLQYLYNQKYHTSPGENSSKTEDKTSSEREDVKCEVMRPIPFAADQRTTVFYNPMATFIW